MWIVVDADTGEIIEEGLLAEPTPQAGRESHRQPRDPKYGWSPAPRAWFVTDLDAVREQRWAAVKTARDAAQDGGCDTPLGRVDSGLDSRVKINGAVTMAQIAMAAEQVFAIGWTMQDNAVVEHDGPAMIAMGLAVGRHVAACHAISKARRAALEAATDLAAIDAVPVESGWPGASSDTDEEGT